MSLTTNDSKASAGVAIAATNAATSAESVRFRPRAGGAAANGAAAARATTRACRRSLEQAGEVIEKSQRHQHRQHGHADALADLEGAVGYRTALDDSTK